MENIQSEMIQKRIVTEFAEAVANFDIESIDNLLLDGDEYNIIPKINEDDEEEAIEVSKNEFILWLSDKFITYKTEQPEVKKLNYSIDLCIHCKAGNPVVLFEKGIFPFKTTKLWKKEKLGLALGFKNGKISDLTFCGGLLVNENKYLYQLVGKNCEKNKDL